MFHRKVTPIQQMEAAECGVACLAMILEYHGCSIPLEELRDVCGTSRDGNTARQLVEAGQSLGLDGFGSKLTIDDLEKATRPLILHWSLSHFVVLERFRGNRAILLDPASGRVQVDRAELDRRFSGVAIDFSPTRQLQRRKRRSAGLLRYFKYLRGAKSMLAFVVIAAASAQLLGVSGPAIQQVLIDEVIRPVREGWLIPTLALLIGVSLASLVLRWLYRSSIARLQTALSSSLTEQMGRHLLRLPLEFIEGRSRGDLLQRVQAHAGLGHLLTQTALAAFHLTLGVALAALMLGYDVKLALIALSVDISRIGLIRFLRREVRERSAGELAARGQEVSLVVQAASSGEAIRAFGLQQRLQDWYRARLIERLRWTRLSSRLHSATSSWLSLFDSVAESAVVWFGGMRVIDSEMTIGVFAGFLSIRALLSEPLSALVGLTEAWVDFRSVLGRTDEVLDKAPEVFGARNAQSAPARLELRNVGFRYGSGSPWVVRGVSLLIEPGESVALVGPSGHGKSTILRLLCGVLSPTEGEVLLGGAPLRDCSAESLVRKMGVVVGPPVVLGGTVEETLRIRAPEASDASLRKAAQLACFEEVLRRLPGGYAGVLQPQGTNISGGERQRLGLAQALLEGPDLLLLDEATCHLDEETEARIIQNICQTGTTVVSVAHRPAIVSAADRVFVVDHGQVKPSSPSVRAAARELPPCRTVQASFKGAS